MKYSPSRIFAKVAPPGIFLAILSVAYAQTTFTLVDEASLVNHWPGLDGLIGSADDVVSANPSTSNGSAPNSSGAASYNAFDFGQGTVPDANLFPPNRQAITYLDAGGTISVDMTVAENGGGPLILGWDISGSEPFPGHGAYSAQITAVNSGSYNPNSHSFSQNVDFTANLTSGAANSSNFDLSGTAYVILSADFGESSGNDYVDSVLIPIAQSMNADGLIFLAGSGIVPAADNFGFPQMPITAAIFALMTETVTEPLPQPEIMLSEDLQSVVVTWPSSADTAILESSANLNSEPVWTIHSPPYESAEDENVFTYTTTEGRRFFRLRTP
jgi:hypothetical protein